MKIIACLLICMGCNALFAAVPPAIRPDAKIETRIEKILGRLTLEEKIGQMCQLTVSMVTDMNDSGHPFISDELLDTSDITKSGRFSTYRSMRRSPGRHGRRLSVGFSVVRSTAWGFPAFTVSIKCTVLPTPAVQPFFRRGSTWVPR